MSYITAVRDFLCTCPMFENIILGVDYLSEHSGEAAVEGVAVPDVLREYTDGSALCGYSFVISARLPWVGDENDGIEAQKMFEQISMWLDESSEKGTLPNLGDLGYAIKVEALPNRFGYDGKNCSARYQMVCRMIFYKRGREI